MTGETPRLVFSGKTANLFFGFAWRQKRRTRKYEKKIGNGHHKRKLNLNRGLILRWRMW
jgi:hypothetical protein